MVKIGCFSFKNGIMTGGKLGKKNGIEIVRFSRSDFRGPAGTSMYKFGESNPLPPPPQHQYLYLGVKVERVLPISVVGKHVFEYRRCSQNAYMKCKVMLWSHLYIHCWVEIKFYISLQVLGFYFTQVWHSNWSWSKELEGSWYQAIYWGKIRARN